MGDGTCALGAWLLPTVEPIPVGTWKTSNGPPVTMAASDKIPKHLLPFTASYMGLLVPFPRLPELLP